MHTKIEQLEQWIEERSFNKVIDSIKSEKDLSGKMLAIRGLAQYMTGNYEASITDYELALKKEPDTRDWEDILQQAKINASAKLNEFVPEVYFFESSKLSSDLEQDPSLPEPTPKRKASGKFRISRTILGYVLGVILTWIFDGMTWSWGRLAGYRDKIWTNWYRRPAFFGVLTLAYMRNELTNQSLFKTYPTDAKVGFLKTKNSERPQGVQFFRTENGCWNNLNDPYEGAAGTRFMRNVDNDAIQSELSKSILEPNPRKLSRLFLTRKNGMVETPFHNMLVVAWIQFQTHDWVSHGEALQNSLIEIPLEENDPARLKYRQTKMFVGRTQPDPTKQQSDTTPITFINEVTHWWDGSQIYGSDFGTSNRLRSHKDGKLKIQEDGTLPLDRKKIEETGYVRNWWVGLALFHTLFVKEHNSICDMLKHHYPNWDDNQLFHIARLINSALMARIHTIEWNSLINPNKIVYSGNHSNWYGFLTTALRSKNNWKTVADLNVRNTELGGVVGNPIERHGTSFGLTQEFVEAYRLHSLLPEELKLRKIGADQIEDIPFSASRQSGSARITAKYGIANLFYSMGKQHPGQLVFNNFPKFMQELSIPGNPLYDMGAVDILRSRERGVPRYNEFRRQLGLNPITKFEDLTSNPEHIEMLKEGYGDHPEAVEMLDLMIGTLAEEKRPTGFAMGETQFQLFLLNATRRLQADRFYTDCYTEKYYTKEGMEWIDSNTLKSVLLRHYPELAKTGLSNINNAFEPWDEEEKLDPDRHPLRAFDPDTKKDPWTGDNYK